MPAANCTALTRAWEHDQGLVGFTDAVPGSEGARFRARVRSAVLEGLRQSHCAEAEGSWLWTNLCSYLHPLQPGENERQLLSSWLVSEEEPIRAAVAPVLADAPEADELTLVATLLSRNMPPEVRLRLDAIVAYERVSRLLDRSFAQLLWVGTQQGTDGLTPSLVAHDPLLVDAATELSAAVCWAQERLEALDGDVARWFVDRLGRFEYSMTAAELAEALLAQHEWVQAGKAPRGKRSWFDRNGASWVVRSIYRVNEAADLSAGAFVHPYRLASLQTFMKDLAP